MNIDDIEDAPVDLKCNIDKKIFPKNFEYSFIQFEMLTENHNYFKTIFHANIKDKSEIGKWIEEFERLNKISLSIKRSRMSTKHQIGIHYECHRNPERVPNGRTKYKQCPFKISFKVNPGQIRWMFKGHEKKVYTCLINLQYEHNHAVGCAEFWRRLKVESKIDEKLVELYQNGHSVQSSLQCLLFDLELALQPGENIEQKMADRSIYPDIRHCQNIFKKTMSTRFKKEKDVLKYVDKFNKDLGEVCIKSNFNGDDSIIAICNPFMKRAHSHLVESSQIVFVDCWAGFKNKDLRIFLFLANSCAGGLPLAVGIIPSETIDNLIRLFELVKEVLPDGCFNGRGELGPVAFVTDDSEIQTSALLHVWPNCRTLLCQFNVLQAVWQWLVNEENGIEQVDRAHCMAFFSHLLYASSEDALMIVYNKWIDDNICLKYQNYINYINDLMEMREKWSVASRSTLFPHADHINKYSEAAMRVLKDDIFDLTTAFTVIQLTHFLTFELTRYYAKKALNFARFGSPAVVLNIHELDRNIFSISSLANCDKKFALIDIGTKTCTCSMNEKDGRCSHIADVIAHIRHKLTGDEVGATERRNAHYIATSVWSNACDDNISNTSANFNPKVLDVDDLYVVEVSGGLNTAKSLDSMDKGILKDAIHAESLSDTYNLNHRVVEIPNRTQFIHSDPYINKTQFIHTDHNINKTQFIHSYPNINKRPFINADPNIPLTQLLVDHGIQVQSTPNNPGSHVVHLKGRGLSQRHGTKSGPSNRGSLKYVAIDMSQLNNMASSTVNEAQSLNELQSALALSIAMQFMGSEKIDSNLNVAAKMNLNIPVVVKHNEPSTHSDDLNVNQKRLSCVNSNNGVPFVATLHGSAKQPLARSDDPTFQRIASGYFSSDISSGCHDNVTLDESNSNAMPEKYARSIATGTINVTDRVDHVQLTKDGLNKFQRELSDFVGSHALRNASDFLQPLMLASKSLCSIRTKSQALRLLQTIANFRVNGMKRKKKKVPTATMR